MNEKDKVMNLPCQKLKCEKCGTWKIIRNVVGIPDEDGIYDIHFFCECITCNCTSRVTFGDEDEFSCRLPWNKPAEMAGPMNEEGTEDER